MSENIICKARGSKFRNSYKEIDGKRYGVYTMFIWGNLPPEEMKEQYVNSAGEHLFTNFVFENKAIAIDSLYIDTKNHKTYTFDEATGDWN